MRHHVNNDTYCKIFQAFGKDAIDEMEGKVNDYIDDENIHVISLTPQMCTIGDQNEMYQTMTITLWYRYASASEIEAAA